METATELLTENQVRELAESRAALARVKAEEKIAPVVTKAPITQDALDRLVADWKLCDCRTDAKFAALLGKPRTCPFPSNPERGAWFKEYDRARGFADAQEPEKRAFDAGWAAGFHFPKEIGFPIPEGELGKVWIDGRRRGVASRDEIESGDPCLHNPAKAKDMEKRAVCVLAKMPKALVKTPLAPQGEIVIAKGRRKRQVHSESVIKQVLAARRAGMTFAKIDIKFGLDSGRKHGMVSYHICEKHGEKRASAKNAASDAAHLKGRDEK